MTALLVLPVGLKYTAAIPFIFMSEFSLCIGL
jgi:hypothetical protein